ncbi:MAG TPA: hypothetical protein VH328_03525, partial [Burkholderiaceae bacterium]|nr:hypothetical protein [Burkholderiaceae bacterium]
MRAHSRDEMEGDLLEAIYRAALDPGGWDDVMTLTRRRFPSAMQAFYFLDRRRRALRLVRLDGVEERRVGEFDALYFAADNPFMQVSAELHRPGVVRTNERIDGFLGRAGAIYASAYYNDWMRPQGFRYTLGNTLLADGDHVANITLMRPAGMGTFGDGEVRAFESLSRHMARALEVAVRLERIDAGAEGASFDALPQALALIDRERRPCHANPAMENLLRARRGLAVEAGAIVALDPAAQA